jgi:hypothetical protein
VLLLASSRVQEKPSSLPPPSPTSVRPPHEETAEPRNPSRPWRRSDVASEQTSRAHLVQKTRSRRPPRSPPPIEDEEHPRRRQLHRGLAGPARRRRRIRRPQSFSDPATTSVRTTVSSCFSQATAWSPSCSVAHFAMEPELSRRHCRRPPSSCARLDALEHAFDPPHPQRSNALLLAQNRAP